MAKTPEFKGYSPYKPILQTKALYRKASSFLMERMPPEGL
jgi:hypothetical protein